MPIGGVAWGRVCACDIKKSGSLSIGPELIVLRALKELVENVCLFLDKVVELVGGGSVINGAYPV